MPQFSTHESVSLEKQVDLTIKLIETKPEDINNVYEINKCVEWIRSNNFQKVCLQFPDYLLPDSSEVALKLQSILNQTVYVLGDTAYESCCIDYVASAHIAADAIIHYGPVCFSKTSADIPYLNIYEKHDLNVANLKYGFSEQCQDITKDITVLIDTPYIHRIDGVLSVFDMYKNVTVKRIDENPLVIKSEVIIFIGAHQRKLANIEFSFQPKLLYYYDGHLQKYEVESKILKRRNYLIEKIKDSSAIGIIIGTLAVKNYLKVIDRIKKLIELSGKKYYLISVGKPTVAKLANFPEIDIYVVITCSLSEIYDSRDFYKPIATPFDVEMALNLDSDINMKFSYDYNTFLSENFDADSLRSRENVEGDVSLLTNKIRTLQPEGSSMDSETLEDTQVALKEKGTLALNSNYGAGFLNDRSWKGLEQNLGKTEVELAQEGRSGIAQKYKNEAN